MSDGELVVRVSRLEAALARLETVVAGMQCSVIDRPATPMPERISEPVAHVAQAVEIERVVESVEVPSPAGTSHDLETLVGTYWLSRAGMGALVAGIALYITFHFGELGAVARVLLGYLAAATLSGFGLWLARRWRLFGELLLGGGLALAYFVTYALHFVASVRVIDAPEVAFVLLGGAVLGIVGAAQRLRSETVAGIAMSLGLHASMLGSTTVSSVVATSFLAAGALVFVLRNRWVVVPLSCLVAAYATHLWWRMQNPSSAEPAQVALGAFVLGVTFVVFNAAVLVRPHALPVPVMVTFAVLNGLGFVGLGAWEIHAWAPAATRSAWLIAFLVSTAAALVGAAKMACRKEAEALVQTLLAEALLTAAFAVLMTFSGHVLVLGLAGLGACAPRLREGPMSLRVVGVGLLAVAAAATMAGPAPVVPAVVAAAFLAELRRGRPAHESFATGWRVTCSLGVVSTLARATMTLFPSSLAPLAWTTAAVAAVAAGFVLRERVLRLTGLGLLALAIGWLVVDGWRASTDHRIVTFLVVGVSLLALSFAYTRLRERIGRWL